MRTVGWDGLAVGLWSKGGGRGVSSSGIINVCA